MKTRAVIAALSVLIALPAAAQEMFFYPSQGQSPEQQTRDQGECHAWAVRQTGFDPASPPAPAAAPAGPQRHRLRDGLAGVTHHRAEAVEEDEAQLLRPCSGRLVRRAARSRPARAQPSDAGSA